MSQGCAVRTPLTKRSSCSICRACDSKTRRCPRLGSARSSVRDTVNGRPCRLQYADAPLSSIRQLSLMAGRNTTLEEDPTQSRVVAVERGFHPSLQLAWHTNARVLRAHFEVHANFVLGSELVRNKIDETRLRAGPKSWSSASAPAAFSSRSAARGCRPMPRNWVTSGGAGDTEADGAPGVEWLHHSKRIIIVRSADLSDFFRSFSSVNCVFFFHAQ